jgi:methionyl-tRNA synthetase
MKIFLTSTLPYNNSQIHVGMGLEIVQADSITRYLKQKGYDVFFNTGLDEEGLKIYQKAKSLGKDTQTFLDEMAETWVEAFKKLLIDYDVLYRTSNHPKHADGVQKFWKLCEDKGYIYKKLYKGKYCSGCESYKTDQDLIEGKCLDHFTLDINEVEEENYFFRLTSFKEALFEDINNSKIKLQPQSKMTELISLIENCSDVSISRLRSQLPCGVEVPDDPEHTVYVWFSALCNYFISAGWPDDNFKDNWQNVIQLFGNDNLRFQGVLFQAMLKAADIPCTSKLLMHGTVLDEKGHKMSKTVGNVVDPIIEIEKYGLRAVRYYILAGLNTYQNSPWSSSDLITLHNSDLANDYGNLLSRVIHLLDKQDIVINESIVQESFKKNILNIVDESTELFDNFELKQGLQKLNQVFKYSNKYITQEEPWKNKETAPVVVNNLVWVFRRVAELYEPFIPGVWVDTCVWIAQKNKEPLFPRIQTL